MKEKTDWEDIDLDLFDHRKLENLIRKVKDLEKRVDHLEKLYDPERFGETDEKKPLAYKGYTGGWQSISR